jgi:Fe-S-cluster containining protein
VSPYKVEEMSDNKSTQKAELPDVIRGRRILGENDRFSFGCHADLPCFTDCCGDINIMLTPVDVVRLARHLDLETGAFLQQHTLMPITKDLNLPVVMLKMGDDEKKSCPFVSDKGCGVYEDRPWACRMYPIGMGLPPARAGEEPEPVYFLFEDNFCKGTGEKKEWTVEEWKNNQRVPEQEAIEEGFSGVVSHPWFIGGRQLDPKRIDMYHMACFNLDNFRSFIFESTFLKRFEIEEEVEAQIRTNDDALLQFAFRWLRFALFAEPTIKVRESA